MFKKSTDRKIRLWGNNAAFALALLMIFASARPETFHLAISGLCILFFSIAYRSIKKRKNYLANKTLLRLTIEVGCCAIGLLLILAQNGLKTLIINDPTNNLLIPIICCTIVGIAFFKKPILEKEKQITNQWASKHKEIKSIYFYGSRVKGSSHGKSDLDIALVLDDDSIDLNKDNLLSYWMSVSELWQQELQNELIVKTDLQLYEPNHSKNVGNGPQILVYQKSI